MKRLSFTVKEQMVQLAGACFWYWSSFHSFLDSCGVPGALYKRYPREGHTKYQVMRNVITDLEERGADVVIQSLVSNFYRLKGAVDRDNLNDANAKRLLDDFRQSVGNDPIEAAIREQAEAKAKEEYKTNLSNLEAVQLRLADLNTCFLDLASGGSYTPQQRGFALEKLLFDLLQFSEIEHRRPYRTQGGEQIDGHFKFDKFDYLVEAKWLRGQVKQAHISVFDGKIRGKAQSTRGLFLAAEGFDPLAVTKFSGESPRILLMSGEDFALVLSGAVGLHDLIRAKVDAMVRQGRIDYPARDVLRGL